MLFRSAEETLLADGYLNVIESDEIQIGEWIEKQFTIRGAGLASMNAKDLAMVALRFNNAENLNLHLGEFSIVRGSYEAPQKPIIESTTLLAANHKGVDGKIIFNMPNDKPLTETCYNIDVNTSLFKLYAQQMEQEPILMSSTTSWAGLYFSVPFGFENNRKIRFGVSAMSLDMNHESEISWSEYLDVEDYVISDDIELNKNTIKPNEGFTVSYVDPQHELGKFEIIDKAGNIIKSVEDVIKLELEDGNAIEEIGAYTLRVTGKVADANGNRVDQTRSYSSYIQVTPLSLGALPRITTLTANDEESDIKTSISTPISLKYTGIQADGESSQGLDLGEKAFGFSASEMEMQPYQSFSIAFWAKINQISTSAPAHFVNIRDKTEGWPKNNWGWTWCNIANNGTLSVTFRGSDATSNNALHYRFANTKIETGPWAHYVYVYEYNNAQQIKFSLYINGERQEVTSWKRNQGNETSGEAPFQGNLYPMRGANMVAIGGTAADRSGLDGIIDNFQYWNKALTAEEVLTTMDSYDEIPQDLYGYWDFEESANASGEFENSGIKKNVVGIYHTYIDSDGEGQGNVSTETGITYKPGSPFVKGTVYKVTTVPTWSVDKGNISETKGNDMEGSANVQFAKPGVYTATLTLQNGWGSDSKTFQYITVGDTGIEDQNLEASLSAYPNPFINEVNVCFSNAGEYTIRIYNLEGIVIAEKTQQVEANEIIRININADAGAYIGQILSNNKLIQAVKLIKQ